MTVNAMMVALLTPDQWERQRFSLLRFVRRHGERRITTAAWRRFVALDAAALTAPGTAVAVALTAGRMPAGVVFASGYGESVCLIAVHPALRGRGIGRRLMAGLAHSWGRLACRVATDNPASMAMCFASGMAAVGLECGPTGKATLIFRWEPGSEHPGRIAYAAESSSSPVSPAIPAGR